MRAEENGIVCLLLHRGWQRRGLAFHLRVSPATDLKVDVNEDWKRNNNQLIQLKIHKYTFIHQSFDRKPRRSFL